MDALILSCGTGGGHNTAGRAVEQELAAAGHNVTFLDPFLLKGKRTSSTINNAYIGVAQRAPHAFGAVYALGNAYRRLPFRSPVYFANRSMVPLMEKYLDEHPCDVIVATHLFPAEILTNMKAHGRAVPPVVFIATDYACIPFTEETDCDRYVIPSPAFLDEFASCGIPRERLAPLGIPVRREFMAHGDSLPLRAGLELPDNEKVVLVAGGSIGAGGLEAVVETALDCFDGRLVVICGNNARLYDRLREQFGDNRCRILTQTSRMADYMRCCDVFVSKPGGLSSTEAANVGSALIHVTPIPGCETRNMEFFAAHGMCLPVTEPKKELPAALEQLLDGAARAEMAACQRKFIPQDAAPAIRALLESLSVRA